MRRSDEERKVLVKKIQDEPRLSEDAKYVVYAADLVCREYHECRYGETNIFAERTTGPYDRVDSILDGFEECEWTDVFLDSLNRKWTLRGAPTGVNEDGSRFYEDKLALLEMDGEEIENEFNVLDTMKPEPPLTLLREIDNTTVEGKMLIAAIGKLSTESQTSKTPDEIVSQLSRLVDLMYEGTKIEDAK